MRVNPRDGCCRSCNGQLEIVDALDDALTVRVGRGPSVARWRVPDVAAARELLRALV